MRCGPRNQFRVFYSVDERRKEVRILAIGVKERNELRIVTHEKFWNQLEPARLRKSTHK